MNDYHLVKEIFDVSHTLKHTLNAFAEDRGTGLSGFQMRLLGFIERQNEEGKIVYQKSIEDEFRIKGSSVSSVIDTLENNGYIVRKPDESDRRKKKLVITDKARECGKKNFGLIKEYEKLIAEALTDDELNELYFLLNKINERTNDIRGK